MYLSWLSALKILNQAQSYQKQNVFNVIKVKYNTIERFMLKFSSNTTKPALIAMGHISMTLNNELI